MELTLCGTTGGSFALPARAADYGEPYLVVVISRPPARWSDPHSTKKSCCWQPVLPWWT